ncbi:hypothetical protein CDL15_Pgr014308 [Punica granatum]|nr:hypothetical protein CDL15_Pgr014308 [Punica granatum]
MQFVHNFQDSHELFSQIVRELIPLSGEAGVVEHSLKFLSTAAGVTLKLGLSSHPFIFCIHTFCGSIAFGFELHRNGCFSIWMLMILFIYILASLRRSHESGHQSAGGVMQFVHNFQDSHELFSQIVRELIPLSGEAGVVECSLKFLSTAAGVTLKRGLSSHPFIICIHTFCGVIAFGFELHRNGRFSIWMLMILFICILALV